MSSHITSTNFCKYLYTLVEESWLQSEFRICGCFLSGYIHADTAIMNSRFGLQFHAVHQTLLQLYRDKEKEIITRISVVFISMNKLQTHWYGDILVQHYTQLQQQGVLDCMGHRHCLPGSSLICSFTDTFWTAGITDHS